MSEKVTYMYAGGKYEYNRETQEYDKWVGDGDGPPKDVTSVTFDNDITQIGERVFQKCTKLTTVALPSALTNIGDSAFRGCTGLTTVALPSSLTQIGSSAFSGCTGLTTVALPSSLTQIGDHAFYGCASILSVNLPNSVTSVGNSVFDNCPFLQRALDAQTNHTAMIEFIRHRFDEMPLHEFCHQSDENTSPRNIEEYHAKDKDATKKVDGFKMTPLHLLALSQIYDIESFQFLLKHCPSSARKTDVYGNTPMHYLYLNIGNGVTTEVTLEHTQAVLNVAPETAKQANANQDVPLVLAIRSKISLEVLELLFAHYPIGRGDMDNDAEIDQLREVAKQYIISLSSKKSLSISRQNAWVTFVSSDNILSLSKELVEQVEHLVKECKGTSDVEVLAHAKDSYGRTAIEVAVPKIKKAMQKRLLFLGRYDIVKGTPIHKSATSVIVKAYDAIAHEEYKLKYQEAMKEHDVFTIHNLKSILSEYGMEVDKKLLKDMMERYDTDSDKKLSEDEFANLCTEILDGGHKRTIVLKFFSNKTQFDREVDSRGQRKDGKDALDKKFVVHILETHDLTKEKPELMPRPDLNLKGYKHIITMPYADRNLDTIFRSERLDKVQTCSQAKEILEAISHLHENNIIHGDIKLLNIVRIQGSLSLIDFDASSKKTNDENQTFIGSKFSSGVLPPEMIAKMTTRDDFKIVEEYFKCDSEKDPEQWEKIKPRLNGEVGYMVKTYNTCVVVKERIDSSTYQVDEPLSLEELPYKLENAAIAIDIWSYGVLLFTLLTKSPLFKVNRDDDLENEKEMAELYDWNKTVLSERLDVVSDLIARDLLDKLLQPEPENRISAKKAIEHPYFKRDKGIDTNDTTQALQNIQKELKEVKEGMKQVKDINALILENTVNLIDTNIRTTQILEHSTSTICQAVFDATEVMTPTCFVIVPYDETILFSSSESDSKVSVQRITECAEKLLNCVNAYNKCASSLGELVSAARNKFKDTMYLYLVDEYTGKPVHDVSGPYPIKIKTNTEVFEKILPVLALGVTAVKLLHGATGVARMFYPFLPQLPDILLNSVENVLDKDDSHIKKFKGEEDTRNKKLRGSELREFTKFLKKRDPEMTYSNLRRICKKSTGNAIWVTDDSAAKIREDNTVMLGRKDLEARNNRLSHKADEFKEELRKAKEEADEFKKKLEDAEKTFLSRAGDVTGPDEKDSKKKKKREIGKFFKKKKRDL